MRLFIAINFNDHFKNQLDKIIDQVRPYSTQGRFVDTNNLHLTLEFLGEVKAEDVGSIKEILNSIHTPKFMINLTDLGYFKTRKGRTYWLGIKNNKQLIALQQSLRQQLNDKGFEVDERPYHPHITFGRKLELKKDFETEKINRQINTMTVDVNNIDLMESNHVAGQLKYSVIASKQLV